MDYATLFQYLGFGLLGIAVVALFMKSKKSITAAKWSGVSAAILLVAVFVLPGAGVNLAFLGNQVGSGGSPLAIGDNAGAGTGGVTQELPSGFCPGIEDTTVKWLGYDAYNTSAAGGTHRYSINGALVTSTISDAGTATLSPGDVIETLWENGATTSYFSAVSTVSVPCSGTFDIPQPLSMNGSLTSTFLESSAEQPITGLTGVNQTLGVGDVKTVDMKLSGQYQTDYPYGFIAVFDYNATEIDNVILSDVAGNELIPATTPQSYTEFNPTANVIKTYLIAAPLKSTTENVYQVTIDSDNTYNPGAGLGTTNVTVTLYPRNYFLNEQAGGKFDGPAAEDESNTLTRSAYALQDQIFYG